MENEKPPILKIWKNLYLLVVAELIVVIILLYFFTKYYE